VSEPTIYHDHQGRTIRLTDERWRHILDHPEMRAQRSRLVETLSAPDAVVATVADETVLAYHRPYERTPVTRKYLVVIVKLREDDAFMTTAFFASRAKRGHTVWRR